MMLNHTQYTHLRTLSLTSILASRFILNLRQINHDLAHRSDPSVSLSVHFAAQTQPIRSLPRSLQLLAQPVHCDIEDVEGDTEEISTLDTNIDQTEESPVIGSMSGDDQTAGSQLKSSGLGSLGAGKQRR